MRPLDGEAQRAQPLGEDLSAAVLVDAGGGAVGGGDDDGVDITATARTADRTGVEMEALTSVAVAGLTMIDMVKAVDPRASITDVRLLAKSGGKSGEWTR